MPEKRGWPCIAQRIRAILGYFNLEIQTFLQAIYQQHIIRTNKLIYNISYKNIQIRGKYNNKNQIVFTALGLNIMN